MGADVRGAARRRAAQAEQACAPHDDRRRPTRGLWLGVALGELALHGRDKLTFVVDEPLRVRSACGSSSSSPSRPASRARASCRSPTSRSARRTDYGDDRVFVHLRDATRPTTSSTRRVAALRDAGHPVLTLADARPGGPRPDLLLRRVRRPRSRAGCSGSTRSTSPTCRRPRTTTKRVLDARRGEPPSARRRRRRRSRALLDGRRRRATSRSWATSSRRDEFDAAVARAARGDPRRDEARRRRSATARASCTRPASSTRAARRPGRFLQLIHDGPRTSRSRASRYTFTHAQARAGRSATCRRCARTGCRPSASRSQGDDPAAALRDLTATIKEMLS